MRTRHRFAALCLAVLLAAPFAPAELTLPALFSDHMVIQCDKPIPVWGRADPGTEVTVQLSGWERTAKADAKGEWRVTLPSVTASEKRQMLRIVAGDEKLELKDVLFGEVWLGSGQSNMAMAVGGVDNAQDEIASADYPLIRMFTVARQSKDEPAGEASGQWQVCSPQTVARFSATAYFFGRHLHKELRGVPVGLVNSSWGGTAVEAWTSMPAQEKVPELQPVLAKWREAGTDYDPEKSEKSYEVRLTRWQEAAKQAKAAGKKPPRKPKKGSNPRLNQNHPANLYNGMIAPLIPYAMRGAIWYQGERNTSGPMAALYSLQLETLIRDWRTRWGQGEFPFIYVQLPNFQTTRNWSVVQEQMLKTLRLPNTGMAVTIDVGDAKNIHPKNKQAVGKRLALWALGTTYERDEAYSGPLYRAAEKHGNAIVVSFEHVGEGLKAQGGELTGFEIAGADRKFLPASAVIEGATVSVSSPEVASPEAVRYAWAANPTCNLFNAADLPASPFRTDEWALDLSAGK
jgi:sialate O-acetylesterase